MRCTTGCRSSSSSHSTIAHDRGARVLFGDCARGSGRSRDEIEVGLARCRGSTSPASSRGSRRWTGRTASRGRGGAARPCSSRRRPAAAAAEPRRAGGSGSGSTRTPTGSPAATAGTASAAGRRAGRDPISSSASSSTGVNDRKNGRKRWSRQTRSRKLSCGAPDIASISSRRHPAAARPDDSGEHRQQRRRERGFEVAIGEAREAVLEGDGLALLGQLEAAPRMAGRLREDRGVRRAAAASRAAAAAVEDRELDAVTRARTVGEIFWRAIDLPLRGEVAAVLGRVRVADHHLQHVGVTARRGDVGSASTISRRAAGPRSTRRAARPRAAQSARAPSRRP